MEQILKVEYDKKTFPGFHITEEEREALNLDENGNKKKDDVKEDL